MRCGTSFYNKTLGRQLTLRFWPLIALYGVIWAIALPISGLISARNSNLVGWAQDLDDIFRILAAPMGACFGVLVAMAVCSHLYATRSCNFTAALPPKRTALFATHYLTGLLWLLVPVVVMSLLALPLALSYGATPLFQGLGLVCMEVLFFYSMAVLCGMLTGHLLALPAFFAIFNGLAMGLWTLLTSLFMEFYYGYPRHLTALPEWVEWLTPSLLLIRNFLDIKEIYPVAAAYAGAGVVLALAAWVLYVKRPMERAGDVVIWAGLRPVFRYGIALCAGLALGTFTRLLLGLEVLGLAVSTMLWGAAGCFVGQMFLTKSVRVGRYWKGAAATACAFAALFVVMHFDLTGYETRVPDSDRVVSVSLSGLNSYPGDAASSFYDVEVQDPQTISLVTQLHQQLVDLDGDLPPHDNTELLSLTYTLSDGTHLSRTYSLPLIHPQVDQPDTITYLANSLLNNPQLLYQAYQLDELDQLVEQGKYKLTEGTVDGTTLTAQQAQQVYQALYQDIWAGNLSHSFFDDTTSDARYLELCWVSTEDVRYVYVFLPDTAQNILAVLDQLGL